MTEKDIQSKIVRLYIDNLKEKVDFDKDSISLTRDKIVNCFVSSRKDVLELEEILSIDISISKVLSPYIKKIMKQPSTERVEYMIDIIDFSLNFTNED